MDGGSFRYQGNVVTVPQNVLDVTSRIYIRTIHASGGIILGELGGVANQVQTRQFCCAFVTMTRKLSSSSTYELTIMMIHT